MSETGSGKVVVNRAISLDGFIAGPGHTMDWGLGPIADLWHRTMSRGSRRPPAPC